MPAIPVRVRLAATALLVVLLIHFSAVQLSPESTYAKKTSIWRNTGTTLGDDRAAVEQLYNGGGAGGGVAGQLSNSTGHGTGAKGKGSARRAKAAFVILARNSDLWSIMESIRFMEDRFNRKYK